MENIPLKDIMYQAKHLMQVAERCKSYNPDIGSHAGDLQMLLQDAKSTLIQEAEILESLLIKGTYTIVSNRKIQTRIEYYISILNFILNVSLIFLGTELISLSIDSSRVIIKKLSPFIKTFLFIYLNYFV